jgi:hypothetical protein
LQHKANLNFPPGLREWDDWQHLVTELHGKAGDAIVFSETCTHGTLPWRADHQRRAILYKYSPSHMAYSGGNIDTGDTMPAWYRELTAPQLATLIKPGLSGRTAAAEAIAAVLATDQAKETQPAKL